ncbi:YodC family protein [Hymenobacter wooponensis]|uniref:DUF2158 domain-containing protein n=1 Tax=Hymenobacter wooponensis TaxID=1525360 RepID=A0A4Z0MSQ3_9BACT|nr:DUF2158 domain-containing protein [Hymenobacter wooponensis]TGD82479.1 DUF2158 domain-containing protein [Hymenobacter wooponensis]
MALLNLGDTVQLKSGGPVMTIVKLTLKQVTCTWFDEQNQLQAPTTFPRDAVKPAASPDAPTDEARENSLFGQA